MNRLTERIMDNVYYLKGKYPPATLCAEMETWEVRECMAKLAAYEDTGFEPKEIKEALEKQLNGGWIPVSERLPEEGMKVLVVSNNDIPIYCVAIMMNGELRVTWNHDRFEHIKIVAWQPLPEPYKEAEND